MKLGCLLSRNHRKAGLVDLLRVTNPSSAVNSTTPLDFRASGLSGSGLVLLAARRVLRTIRRNCRKQGFPTCKRRDARESSSGTPQRGHTGGSQPVGVTLHSGTPPPGPGDRHRGILGGDSGAGRIRTQGASGFDNPGEHSRFNP